MRTSPMRGIDGKNGQTNALKRGIDSAGSERGSVRPPGRDLVAAGVAGAITAGGSMLGCNTD